MRHDLYLFEQLLAAESHTELQLGVAKLAEQLGFPKLFFSPLVDGGNARLFFRDKGVIDPERLPAKNIYTTYPESWLIRYQQAQHIQHDPIVRLAAQTSLPIFWEQAADTTGQPVVFDEAREHGLSGGITIPVHGTNGEWSLFSVASDTDPINDRIHASEFVGQIQLAAFYVHEAARRFGEIASLIVRPLTKREKECLLWASQGKTAWEIGVILNIAEPTAVFHLTNARDKLQATNRRQAVARAISLGLINP